MEQIIKDINEIKCRAKQLGLHNLFYNEQYKELEIALTLGHTYNEGQGADAFLNNGEKCEYKSISKRTGSFQYHWLSPDKLEKIKYNTHNYFAVYENDKLKEIFYLHVDVLMPHFEMAVNNNPNKWSHKCFSLRALRDMDAESVYHC